MNVQAVMESAGLRRNDVRVMSVTAIGVILALTAFGWLAPTTMVLVSIGNFSATDDNLWLTVAGLVTAIFGGGAAAFVAATRLVEHRWPWPLGPRVRRSRPATNLFLPSALAISAGNLGVWVLADRLPGASALYVLDGSTESWLRVVAPVDLAYVMIVGLLLWIMGFTVGVVVVALWRSLNRQQGPVVPADRDPDKFAPG
jgi:hypothetical protein